VSSWFETACQASVTATAAALGLSVATDGRSIGPCPGCGTQQRNNPGRSRDRRLRCRVDKERHWECCSNGNDGCGAKGSAVDLVAWVLLERALVKGDIEGWRRIRSWFGSPEVARMPPGAAKPLVTRPPGRLDRFELAQELFHFPRVDEDAEVAAWLQSRHLDPRAIADLELAFALPLGFRARWALFRGDWDRSGHRLVLPAYEADPDLPGQFRLGGVHARCVRPHGEGEKAASPLGVESRGLIWLTDPVHPWADGVPQRLITICEGATDFLALALETPAKRGALLGAWNGSACADIVTLIPTGWTVVLALHDDPGGAKQEGAWLRLLEGRANVRRYRWPK
jgi:hypothetical protein